MHYHFINTSFSCIINLGQSGNSFLFYNVNAAGVTKHPMPTTPAPATCVANTLNYDNKDEVMFVVMGSREVASDKVRLSSCLLVVCIVLGEYPRRSSCTFRVNGGRCRGEYCIIIDTYSMIQLLCKLLQHCL